MAGYDDKLNVMQVILNLERAGAQEVVRTLTEYLQANGCNVTVCAFGDGPMRAEIERLGVKVELLSRPRYSVVFLPMFLAEMLRIRRELARLIETYHVDVVQTHVLQVLDFLILTLRHDTRLRVVLWTMQNVEFLPKWMPEQNHWLQKSKKWGYRLLYRLMAGQVDGFIAVSDEVRQSLVRQIGPVQDKIFTVCNAVDLKLFERPGDKTTLCGQLGLKADSRLVVTVGRLTEQKGHCYLIDAAASVVSTYPDTHFLFIGDGELRGELQRQAQQAGLSENVHFLGIRKDVPDLLVAADLFVLPSLWEGLSIALLEAMAASKPIVATAVSGTTQAMTHGETGLIVPPRDSQALADAINQLLSDPPQAQALGQAAKQHVVVNFSAQKQAHEHLALYRRLLFGNGS
jgi:glycosyltransferase involved in cell wall biosynthesis